MVLLDLTCNPMLPAVLSQYAKNKNTGNIYEISVLLRFLRSMGLTNDEFETHATFLEQIATYNTTKTDELRKLFQTIKTLPEGTGLTFDGHRISRLECATQDDLLGRTGDILLHTDTGAVLSISVCEGKPKKGQIEKCLTNPTATRFGCTEEDLARCRAIQERTVNAYKAEMTLKYGDKEDTWPSRLRTEVAKTACTEVATLVEHRFATLDKERQRTIINDLLRIEDGKKPADYLALVDKASLVPKFFRFDTPTVTEWSPSLRAEGIYVGVYNAGKKIGNTQVKFNNGVYHKGKTSSLTTSWNATFHLSDLFTMTALSSS